MNTVTYNRISIIINFKKKKNREMSDKVGMRNETYRSVGGERGGGDVTMSQRAEQGGSGHNLIASVREREKGFEGEF